MARRPAAFDPKKRYPGAKRQAGQVRRDSDWNQPAGKSPFPMWMLAAGAVAAGTVVVLLALLFGPALLARVRFPPSTLTVALTAPTHGGTVPLHSTIGVQGEAVSSLGISRMELWVNAQVWGARDFDPAQPIAAQVWGWTPSGEGMHELIVRAFDGRGRAAESQRVRVLASSQADVRFPLDYVTQAGDNVDALAEAAGIDRQDILEANPGLPPLASLPAGIEVLLPVPVPNGPPSSPQGGGPAAPPIAPLDQVDPADRAGFLAGIHLSPSDPSAPGFWFYNGAIAPGEPVDRLYLYHSVGAGEWKRIPENPQEFLHPTNGLFLISDYLDIAALEASPTPVRLRAEAWGWSGSTLVYLGYFDGMLGGGAKAWPPSDASLQIFTYQALGIPHYAGEINLTGEDPSLDVDFEWDTSVTGVSAVRWQVSTSPFPPGVGLNPPGLIHQGTTATANHRFTLYFDDYFDQPGGGGGFGLGDIDDIVGKGLEDLQQLLQGGSDPTQEFPPFLPQTFYVRIVPLHGGSPLAAQPAGSASNTAVVRYLPTGESLPEGPIGGPIYEARIVAFTPYRAVDPKYSACMVLAEDLHFPPITSGATGSTWPAGTPSCGCPGVSCDNDGGSDCGELSLDGFSDCVNDIGGAFAGALVNLANYGADLYNGAKDFIVDTLSAGLCNEDALGGVIGEEECKLAVNIGVNAGLAALGLPPEIPNLDQLFSQGLEYAIAEAAGQITGFECDATCRALLKKGFEGASNPEALFDEGLAYGAGLAQEALDDYLEQQGVSCDTTCQNAIESAAAGHLSPGSVGDAALQAAAQEASAQLNSQGISCDAGCLAVIADELQKGASLGQAAASTSAQVPPPPTWVPHELALEQPAILTVEVFRRWESAGATNEELERCGVSIDNLATNQAGGIEVSGRVFEPKGIGLPVIGPGETLQFPVVLDRAHWAGPPEYIQASAQEQAAELTAESGVPSVVAYIFDPVLGDWVWLYPGSTVSFRLWGPLVLSMAGGQMQSVPCVAEDASWTQTMPDW